MGTLLPLLLSSFILRSLFSNLFSGQWLHTPLLGRERQADLRVEASLVCKVSPRTARATQCTKPVIRKGTMLHVPGAAWAPGVYKVYMS